MGILLRTFVLGAVRIAGRSMEYTLLPGDMVLISKLTSFIPGSPSIGDVVAVRLREINNSAADDNKETLVVKRLIGAPGDTILVRGTSVWVNGQELHFPSTARASQTTGGRAETYAAELGPVYIPKAGSELALTSENFQHWRPLIESEGHHAEISSDGQIRIDSVITTSYRAGRDYCFLVGDNMTASTDSRAWGVVPVHAVEGRVMLVYWSRDPNVGSNTSSSWFAGIRWNRIGGLVL